jgi:hypothetical protein
MTKKRTNKQLGWMARLTALGGGTKIGAPDDLGD